MRQATRDMLTTRNTRAHAEPLRLDVRHFLLPKENAAPDECEDAIGINERTRTYAIADGATEAFDSGNWAKRLAGSWVETEPAPLSIESFQEWVAAQSRLLHESWQGRTLTWYAEEKARRGSFAAFVGVRVRASENLLGWDAIALGDCCLIHSRGGSVLLSLPVAHHENFNSTPLLVPSHESMHASALGQASVRAGTAERGDVFLLLSDAGAAWYLKLCADASPVRAQFDSLLAATQNESLAELLRNERRAGALKDDDVAALRISIA
jgi:hypothetical protein